MLNLPSDPAESGVLPGDDCRRLPEAASRSLVCGDIVCLSLGLAALLVCVKAALLPFPVSTAWELVRWCLRLAVVSAPDICFAAALAAVCLGGASLLSSRLAWAHVFRGLIFFVYYIAGMYAIASVPIYQVTKLPLTLPLLSFAGGPRLMASSIRDLVPLSTFLLLVAAPAAVLLVPGWLRRWGWPFNSVTGEPADIHVRRKALPCLDNVRGPEPMAIATGCLLVAALYGGVCQAYIHKHWTDPNRWERRIARSPHAVFLASCVGELLKDRPLALTTVFPDADVSDFSRPELNAATVDKGSLPHREAPDPPRAALPPGRAPANRPTSAILIVLESTGVEYLGLYGSKYPTTPRLEQLVSDRGVVFDNCYVQSPNSCKSLVALTAGVYARPDWRLIVRDCPEFDVPTLADVLTGSPQNLLQAQLGPSRSIATPFRTCFLHSGYWSWKNRDRYLTARGAQTLVDASNLPGAQVNSWGASDQAMYQAALDWISQDPSRPFFVFAYTIETHHPYVAPPRLHDFGVDDPELNRYLNAVRGADEKIAWLMDQLELRGLAESTVVAVTADHGESFGQHDQRVHSFGIYEPDVHVPLVILHPSLRDVPKRQPRLASHLDIPPTLLGMLGFTPPAEWQGRDVFASPAPERVYFFSTGNEVALGLREGDWKYHYYVDSGREELFDLGADRGELENLAPRHADRCAAYRKRVGGLVEFQREFLARHGAR